MLPQYRTCMIFCEKSWKKTTGISHWEKHFWRHTVTYGRCPWESLKYWKQFSVIRKNFGRLSIITIIPIKHGIPRKTRTNWNSSENRKNYGGNLSIICKKIRKKYFYYSNYKLFVLWCEENGKSMLEDYNGL